MRFRTIVIAALAGTALAGLGAVASAAGAPRAHHATPIKVTVTARDFSFTFSKAKVPHGSTVIFTVVNKGQLDHNLVFQTLKKHSALIGPGKKSTFRVAFPKAGRFYYICSVPNHAQAGMAGSFQVT